MLLYVSHVKCLSNTCAIAPSPCDAPPPPPSCAAHALAQPSAAPPPAANAQPASEEYAWQQRTKSCSAPAKNHASGFRCKSTDAWVSLVSHSSDGRDVAKQKVLVKRKLLRAWRKWLVPQSAQAWQIQRLTCSNAGT